MLRNQKRVGRVESGMRRSFLVLLLVIWSVPAMALEVSEEQFLDRDLDGDGQVTREELPLKRLFRRLDKNRDGVITRAECGLEELPSGPQEPLTLAPTVIPANQAALLGQTVDLTGLVDLDGRPVVTEDAIVVVILRDPDCPVAAKLAPAVTRLAESLVALDDVVVVLLHIGDDRASALADLEKHGFAGRYVHDEGATIAARFDPETTTESFVLDASGSLRYRGAIDDQYGIGYSRDTATWHFLSNAVDAVVDAREPAIVATAAPGCRLDLSPNSSDGAITWHGRVSRIFARNCVECHHDGGPGPFALETYDQVSGRRKGMIAAVVDEGIMPPWFAAPQHGTWANDRRLHPEDKRDLLAWIEAGCPEGDPTEGIAMPETTDAWQIGEPDLVIELPKAVTVAAEGTMPYVNLSVKNPLKEDVWIEAYEVRPTAPAVVHHALIFLQDGDRRSSGGLHGFFAAMVPGQATVTYQPGFAKKLPAGATMKFQMHYTTNGTEQVDRTRLGLRFAKAPPQHEVITRSSAQVRFAIPPHAKAHRVVAERRIVRETVLLSFMPHMHVRGSAYRYELVAPDGTTTTLLDIPAYDFDWQLRYVLAEPVRVAKGSVIRGIGTFDNSAGNPANPDPDATVRFGEQTWDEMQIGYWEAYER